MAIVFGAMLGKKSGDLDYDTYATWVADNKGDLKKSLQKLQLRPNVVGLIN